MNDFPCVYACACIRAHAAVAINFPLAAFSTPMLIHSTSFTSTALILVGEADVHVDASWCTVPFPFGQLALVVDLVVVEDVAFIPATVFFAAEHGGPEALEVVARLRIDTRHLAQEELLQHSLVEGLWVLVDGFASHGEDGAGLEADG